MSTRISFTKEMIESFEKKYNLSLDLSHEQLGRIDNAGTTTLYLKQLSDTIDGFSSSMTDVFIKFHPKDIPVSISLFVLNDAIWKIMEKRKKHKDRMLPMSTIPWYYWEEESITPTNPNGVTKSEYADSAISINPNKHELVVRGRGGDFCGIVEGRVASRSLGARPILKPTFSGSTEMVPNYENEKLKITLSLKNLQSELYPKPEKSLDYTFSESPKVFYEHGLAIQTDGESVLLKVGNRRETKLQGDIKMFLGRAPLENSEPEENISFHIWLMALFRILTPNQEFL